MDAGIIMTALFLFSAIGLVWLFAGWLNQVELHYRIQSNLKKLSSFLSGNWFASTAKLETLILDRKYKHGSILKNPFEGIILKDEKPKQQDLF